MPDRVMAFLDYQNVYMGRETLSTALAQLHRQARSTRMPGDLLARREPPDADRELAQVRVYRGQPDSAKDPRGYAANDRQCRHWETLPKTKVVTRTLRYPRNWPQEREQEKGIDVPVAIDLVAGAVRGEYEVAISCRPTPT